jgi:hypothetical protein
MQRGEMILIFVTILAISQTFVETIRLVRPKSEKLTFDRGSQANATLSEPTRAVARRVHDVTSSAAVNHELPGNTALQSIEHTPRKEQGRKQFSG